MGLFNFSLTEMICSVIALVIALSFHEFAHGWVAYKLGDPTPKWQGRLSLNPLRHLDPIGTIMMLFTRFGWGKPVMVDPRYFKDPRKGMALVGVAGPAMNLLLAFIFSLPLRFLPQLNIPFLYMLLLWVIVYNLSLAMFNLIPIPPLDGANIIMNIIPRKYYYKYNHYAVYGVIILVILIVSGQIGFVITPLIRFLDAIICGGVLHLYGSI